MCSSMSDDHRDDAAPGRPTTYYFFNIARRIFPLYANNLRWWVTGRK